MRGPVRVACWAAVLLAEVLGLTLQFDTQSLRGVGAWWAAPLAHSHYLPQLLVAVAAAVLLFGGARLRGEVKQITQTTRGWPAWPFALAHLAAFAAFARLTALLFSPDGGLRSSPLAGAWSVAWVLLAGLTLLLWAAAALPANLWLPLARRGRVPLLVGLAVGILACAAGHLTDLLWPPLRHGTFWVVRGLLGLLAARPVCDPDRFRIGTPRFVVEIAPECSGYEGIGLVWVFLAAYLWLRRAELSFPRALLLLPLATAVVYLFNALRIVALIAVGTWYSPQVAAGGFHSQAGWLAFNAVALGVVAVAQRVPFFHRPPAPGTESPPDRGVENPTAAYLVPLLALVAAMMVTAALSEGFDWLYPIRVLATAAALWYFRRDYAGLFRPAALRQRLPAVAVGAVVFGLWLALEWPPSGPAPAALSAAPAAWAGLWLVFKVAGSVLTVPLAEELAFRGYLPRRLQAADFQEIPLGRFTPLSFVVSSALFGLLHYERFLAGTLAGMLYALTLWRRRDLADAVLAHATTNALIAATVLAAGAWSLWS